MEEREKIQWAIAELRRARDNAPGQVFPGLSGGCVVSTEHEDDARTLAYYGGRLVFESAEPKTISFFCVAHRLLPVVLDRLELLEKKAEAFYQLALEGKE